MKRRFFIDRERANWLQELWYCLECKIYHNERVYITIKNTPYWIIFECLCENCKSIKEDTKKQKFPKHDFREFTKKMWVFTLMRKERIFWIINNHKIWFSIHDDQDK